MSTERPDLDAIEALLTAATPGPWLADLDIFDPDDHEIEACVSSADVRILFTSGTGYTYGEAPEVERAAAWAAAKASQQMTDARLIAAAPTALREVIAYARALEAAPNPLTHIPRDEHDREIEALTVRVGHEVAARDAAQARHDADLCEIVAMLREQARIDWRAAERLRRVIAEIETTHAAALARHARRALAPHPEPTPGPRVGDVVTAENVGALPVGTVVRWEHRGEEWRAERVAADLWLAGGIEHDDEEIADEGGPVTTIASLPRVGGGGS